MSEGEFMEKTCFANSEEKDRCKALREKLCVTRGECPFYKTKKRFNEESKRYGNITNFLR